MQVVRISQVSGPVHVPRPSGYSRVIIKNTTPGRTVYVGNENVDEYNGFPLATSEQVDFTMKATYERVYVYCSPSSSHVGAGVPLNVSISVLWCD